MKTVTGLFPLLKRITLDFRFWVCLFFILRLYGITWPPVDTSHAWRQSFTCMVARNFLEQDPDIFLPRTDLAGARPDVVASEFPLFNYLIFIISKIFGYSHWYGRLINLVFSSLGIYAFYLLVRRYFGERTGLFAGLIFLSSAWFMFSRKIMPDTFSVSLVMLGLWALTRYLDKGGWFSLVLFFLLGSFGGLSKIPGTIILALSLIAVINPAIVLSKRIFTLVALLAALMVIVAWYFAWEPFLLSKYQNQLYFPRGLARGINDLLFQWGWTLDKFTFVSLHSYIALFFFILGIYYMFISGNRLLMLILAISIPLLGFFMIKAGYVFATHDYYIIPFVPVMALLAGYGLATFRWQKFAWIFLLFIMAEGVANQAHDFRLNKPELYFLELESIADKVSSRSDRIAITGGLNPQEMYFAHRKGWGLTRENLTDTAFLAGLRKQGCRLLFVNKKVFDSKLYFPVIFNDQHYTIYRFE